MLYNVEIYEERLRDFKLSQKDKIGIYGTGNGATIVLEILKRWNMEKQIVCFVERDECVGRAEYIDGISIVNLKEASSIINVVIIAAMDNHEIIYSRIMQAIIEKKVEHMQIINLFGYYTDVEKQAYLEWLDKSIQYDSNLFVDYDDNQIDLQNKDPKIIAWYLPQYYEMEINNKYYGKGFTEWTNTTQMFPMFTGHIQPHIPYDLGYYSLDTVKTFKRQIELARHYGVYGFSFYYYWFSGTKIMEEPLELFLQHGELNFPFCITWANENWTTLWDAGENHLIYKQELNEGDSEQIIKDMMLLFRDPRYIRINGKPLIIVYRANMWGKEETINCFETFRRVAKENGIEIYICVTNAREFDEEPEEYGADALIEFPPHGLSNKLSYFNDIGYSSPHFVGKVYDADAFVKKREFMIPHKTKKYYRGVMTTWDNSPRKHSTGARVFQGLSSETFKYWLTETVLEGKKIHDAENNYIFVNSWNEWGEGSHLEPDTRFGYAMLKALRDAILECRK